MDVTLKDYVPPARFDGRRYVQARLEEGPTEDGAWAAIETFNLSPLDADPTAPIERNFTSSQATLAEGWYRLVWLDEEGHETRPTPAVENAGEDADGTRPSIAAVASLLRARLRLNGGPEAGTFTDRTRPTADEVADLIDDAQDEVLGQVVAPKTGTSYERRVRGAIKLYAAVLIEGSYFAEQVKVGSSPAGLYERLYARRIKALIAEGETGEPQGDGTGDSPGDAYYGFPEALSGLDRRPF